MVPPDAFTGADGRAHLPSCFGLFLPGAILIRSESGQLVLLSQQALAQTQQGPARVGAPPPRTAAPQVCAGCVP